MRAAALRRAWRSRYDWPLMNAPAAASPLFSRTDDRNQPFDFVLGQGQVIKGWDLGVSGMCPGEMRKLQVRHAPQQKSACGSAPLPRSRGGGRSRYAPRRPHVHKMRSGRGRVRTQLRFLRCHSGRSRF